MSRPPDVPLSDATQLFAFLQKQLEQASKPGMYHFFQQHQSTHAAPYTLHALLQLEEASGGVDEEARAALAKLQGVAAAPPVPAADAATRIASMTEEQLAAHLAGLEQQMAAVEGLLAGSSAETRYVSMNMFQSGTVQTFHHDRIHEGLTYNGLNRL